MRRRGILSISYQFGKKSQWEGADPSAKQGSRNRQVLAARPPTGRASGTGRWRQRAYEGPEDAWSSITAAAHPFFR